MELPEKVQECGGGGVVGRSTPARACHRSRQTKAFPGSESQHRRYGGLTAVGGRGHESGGAAGGGVCMLRAA